MYRNNGKLFIPPWPNENDDVDNFNQTPPKNDLKDYTPSPKPLQEIENDVLTTPGTDSQSFSSREDLHCSEIFCSGNNDVSMASSGINEKPITVSKHDTLAGVLEYWECDFSMERIDNPDIFDNMRDKEIRVQSLSLYISNFENFTPDMRSSLVEWMSDVCHGYCFNPEVYFNSIQYMDRFLSEYTVDIDEFQLAAAACLLIATKVIDVSCVPLSDFVLLADSSFTSEELFDMERNVLKAFEFDLCVPTVLSFAEYYCSELIWFFDDKDTIHFLQSLCELSTLDYVLSNAYYSSSVAGAAIMIATLSTDKKTFF